MVNVADPSGCAGLRRRELPLGAVRGPDGEQRANPRRCRTGAAAFTAVGAPAHPEASATAAGGAGSIPRKHKRSDNGSAS